MTVEKTGIEKVIRLCREQDDFVFGDWKYGGFFGEIGNGKTTSAIMRSNRMSYDYPRNSGMVLRKYWHDNRDTTLEQFHQMVPWERYYKSSEKVHRLPNGSVIFWRGMDRLGRVTQLLNYNLGWFWIEQMEELWLEIWNTLEGRLKLMHVPLTGFGTANPAGHNWCWKTFIAPSKDQQYMYFQPPARWNAPNLPEGYYEEKERTWPKQMKIRFLDGRHEGYEGLLYDIFDRRKHECAMPNIDDFGTWWEMQDYGISDTNPMVWLWIWRAADGRMYIMDEFYRYGCKPSEAAVAVKATRTKNGIRRVEATVGCPRTFQREGTSESGLELKTPADLFREKYGITISKYPVPMEIRYPLVYKEMAEGRLFIVRDKCPNLVSEIEGLTWETIRTAPNHAIEAMERGVTKAVRTVGAMRMKDVERISREIKADRPLTAGLMKAEF